MPSYEEKMEADALEKETAQEAARKSGKSGGRSGKAKLSNLFMPCPHCGT